MQKRMQNTFFRANVWFAHCGQQTPLQNGKLHWKIQDVYWSLYNTGLYNKTFFSSLSYMQSDGMAVDISVWQMAAGLRG